MKKIIKTFLVIYLFFGFIGYVHAETYALNNDESQNGEEVVPENALIIGTHLITDPTKASTRLIMDATQTVVGDDAIIYQKLLDKEDADDEDEYPEGWWIDAISGEDEVPANVNGLICITHVNGEQVQDPDCDATRFAVKFTGITGEQDSKTVSIVNGEKIAAADIPTPKTKKGYEFVCWVKSDAVNEDRSSCYDFSQTISESVDLAPYYDLIKYKITFDLNGLESPTEQIGEQTCTIEQLASPEESNCKLPTLSETRKGYKFDGWSTVKDETGEKGTHFEAEDSMADMLGDEYNITLYAVWTPVLYDITYNLNGGTYENQTVIKSSYNILTKDKIELFVPSRTGYTFTGWNVTSPESGGTVNAPGGDHEGKYTLSVDGDKLEAITLTAQWKEKEYTITYDLNLDQYPELTDSRTNSRAYATMLADLVNPQSTECKFESGCTLADAPDRDDYIFAGWADSDGYLYSENKDYKGIDFKTDTVALTAQWNAKNEPMYTITYNLDGGQFPTEAIDKYGRKTIETQLPTPVKVGYTFEGWCSDEQKSTNCKGTTAKIKEFLENEGAGSEDLNDLTLYAKWKANTYTVEFYEPKDVSAVQLALMSSGAPDEGYQKLEGKDKTCTYDTNCELEKHDDYFETKKEKLRGWSLSYGEKSNNNSIYLSDGITVKNLTSESQGLVKLYAVAEEVKFTITYYLDGGEFKGVPDKTPETTATKDEQITVPNPTKDGYTFDKWVDETGKDISTTSADEENSVKVTVSNNMILVAKWKKDYQIEIYLDGGKFSDDQSSLTSTKYKEGSVVEIPNPVKDGYTFAGWVDKDGEEVSTEKQEPDDKTKVKIKVNSDMLLVATWTQSNPEMKITEDSISDVKKDEWKTIELKISPNNHNGTKVKIVTTITKDNHTLSEQGKVEARLNEVNTILPFLSSETSQNDTSGKLTLPTSKGFRLKPGSACELANIDGACEEKDEDGQVKKKYDFKFSEEGTYKVKFEVYDYNYPEDGPLSSTEITVTVGGQS